MIIGHFSIYCGKSKDKGTCRDAGIFRENLDLSLRKVKNEVVECECPRPAFAAAFLRGNGQVTFLTHKIMISDVPSSFKIGLAGRFPNEFI